MAGATANDAGAPASDTARAPGPAPGAEELAERPATTLAELWAKRLAAAYLADVELTVLDEASMRLGEIIQKAPFDEELRVLASLAPITDVFERPSFMYDPIGAKRPVPGGTSSGDIKEEEHAKRRPMLVAMYQRLGPRGRFHLTVDRDDKKALAAMMAVTRADYVRPLPLTVGHRGFDEFSRVVRARRASQDRGRAR